MKKKLVQQIPQEELLWAIFQVFSEIKEALSTQNNGNEDLIDQADAKKLLNVSDSFLYRLRRSGQLPFIKIGGKIFYSKSTFLQAFKK